MLRIRLRRVGAKKQPSYRVVVADARASQSGRIVDQLGHYDPHKDLADAVIDEDKAVKWLRVGAQPSDAVARILKKLGTLDRVTEQ